MVSEWKSVDRICDNMDCLASQLLIVLKISLEDSSINISIILLYCSVHLVAKPIILYIVNRLCFS